MSRKWVDSFDRANGGLGNVPNGPAWEVLSGTFAISGNLGTSSTAPGSNPMAVVNVGLRSNDRADVIVEGIAQHVYGNAVYGRVVDINNWIRAKVYTYTSSYQYYVTEYQHTTYGTEYEYAQYQYQKEVADYYTEYRHSRQVWTSCTYTGWGGYYDVATTACRNTYPSGYNNQPCASPCGGQDCAQFRITDLGTTGCTSPNRKYRIERRDQDATANYSTEYTWTSSSSSPSGYSYDGVTRNVDSGSRYWVANSSSVSSPDQTTGNWRYSDTGGRVWATSQPGASGDYSYSSTGASRSVATGSYWDTNYESGAPTRQAGPYTGTDYWYGSLVLEKNVGGAITQLGSWQGSDSTAGRALRLTCNNDTLSVAWNGTTRITVTDGSHKNTGLKAGIGGGASNYNATNPSFASFSVEGISPERVRLANATWGTMNKKIKVGSLWVDTDSVTR